MLGLASAETEQFACESRPSHEFCNHTTALGNKQNFAAGQHRQSAAGMRTPRLSTLYSTSETEGCVQPRLNFQYKLDFNRQRLGGMTPLSPPTGPGSAEGENVETMKIRSFAKKESSLQSSCQVNDNISKKKTDFRGLSTGKDLSISRTIFFGKRTVNTRTEFLATDPQPVASQHGAALNSRILSSSSPTFAKSERDVAVNNALCQAPATSRTCDHDDPAKSGGENLDQQIASDVEHEKHICKSQCNNTTGVGATLELSPNDKARCTEGEILSRVKASPRAVAKKPSSPDDPSPSLLLESGRQQRPGATTERSPLSTVENLSCEKEHFEAASLWNTSAPRTRRLHTSRLGDVKPPYSDRDAPAGSASEIPSVISKGSNGDSPSGTIIRKGCIGSNTGKNGIVGKNNVKVVQWNDVATENRRTDRGTAKKSDLHVLSEEKKHEMPHNTLHPSMNDNGQSLAAEQERGQVVRRGSIAHGSHHNSSPIAKREPRNMPLLDLADQTSAIAVSTGSEPTIIPKGPHAHDSCEAERRDKEYVVCLTCVPSKPCRDVELVCEAPGSSVNVSSDRQFKAMRDTPSASLRLLASGNMSDVDVRGPNKREPALMRESDNCGSLRTEQTAVISMLPDFDNRDRGMPDAESRMIPVSKCSERRQLPENSSSITVPAVGSQSFSRVQTLSTNDARLHIAVLPSQDNNEASTENRETMLTPATLTAACQMSPANPTIAEESAPAPLALSGRMACSRNGKRVLEPPPSVVCDKRVKGSSAGASSWATTCKTPQNEITGDRPRSVRVHKSRDRSDFPDLDLALVRPNSIAGGGDVVYGRGSYSGDFILKPHRNYEKRHNGNPDSYGSQAVLETRSALTLPQRLTSTESNSRHFRPASQVMEPDMHISRNERKDSGMPMKYSRLAVTGNAQSARVQTMSQGNTSRGRFFESHVPKRGLRTGFGQDYRVSISDDADDDGWDGWRKKQGHNPSTGILSKQSVAEAGASHCLSVKSSRGKGRSFFGNDINLKNSDAEEGELLICSADSPIAEVVVNASPGGKIACSDLLESSCVLERSRENALFLEISSNRLDSTRANNICRSAATATDSSALAQGGVLGNAKKGSRSLESDSEKSLRKEYKISYVDDKARRCNEKYAPATVNVLTEDPERQVNTLESVKCDNGGHRDEAVRYDPGIASRSNVNECGAGVASFDLDSGRAQTDNPLNEPSPLAMDVRCQTRSEEDLSMTQLAKLPALYQTRRARVSLLQQQVRRHTPNEEELRLDLISPESASFVDGTFSSTFQSQLQRAVLAEVRNAKKRAGCRRRRKIRNNLLGE